MLLESIDWTIIISFFAISLIIGLLVAKKAGSSSSEFFLSGRNMPWWLLGFSMVATTFSTDTPNLVTDFVRTDGVAGNWQWWAFLLTGMLTVFVYAKLWRRSGVMTDIEFYEIRYSGKPAAFLRGFRALYLGVFFNIIVMATVTLAAIKIGGVMFDFTPLQTIIVASIVTVAYSMLGGLRGVLITDFLLFFIAMFGSVVAAVVALNHEAVGGLSNMLVHENVVSKLSLLPDFGEGKWDIAISIFIIPIAVQWWNVWYPGSEPGGGGYIAQRMLAAKDEKHAMGATLFFNAAHYALRPWPWIIVALCSLIVFPDLESLQQAFPKIPAEKVKNDLAYPAMLTFIKPGMLGLVVASLVAAYMSTISTHLNWGSSYVVNDFYKRFVKPKATEKELVLVGRISILIMMAVAGIIALLFLENAKQAFQVLLQIGAGTGLLFILRWFWWRVNSYSEITAMTVSFAIAVYFYFTQKNLPEEEKLAQWIQLLYGVGITTIAWITVTFITKPADDKTLRSFYKLARPGGPGWKAVRNRALADNDPLEPEGAGWNVPMGILCMVAGCFAVYSALFATGYWIYSDTTPAIILTVVALVSSAFLITTWKKVTTQ